MTQDDAQYLVRFFFNRLRDPGWMDSFNIPISNVLNDVAKQLGDER